ncbi:hypothetical protein IT568_07120 [bacterium]|nr:hypothetical protein [bacterium]
MQFLLAFATSIFVLSNLIFTFVTFAKTLEANLSKDFFLVLTLCFLIGSVTIFWAKESRKFALIFTFLVTLCVNQFFFFTYQTFENWQFFYYVSLFLLATLSGFNFAFFVFLENKLSLKILALFFVFILIFGFQQLPKSLPVEFSNVIFVFVLLFTFEKTKEKLFFSPAILASLTAFYFAKPFELRLQNQFYTNSLIFHKFTENNNRIVLTENQNQTSLFLNDTVKFFSCDQSRFYETLVFPALAFVENPQNILLFGDEGMAAKEILKFPCVEKIVIVGTDSILIETAKTQQNLLEVTKQSLLDKRVSCDFSDVWEFLENNTETFDCVLINFPEPENPKIAKLYTKEFFAQIKKLLKPKGIGVTQSFSPFFLPRSFWCVNKTLVESDFFVKPANVNIPSLGSWGFQFFFTDSLVFEKNGVKFPQNSEFFDENSLLEVFTFGNDLQEIPTLANSMKNLTLLSYYKNEIRR